MGIKLSDNDRFWKEAQPSWGQSSWRCWAAWPTRPEGSSPGTVGTVLLILGANPAQHLLAPIAPPWKVEPHRAPGLPLYPAFKGSPVYWSCLHGDKQL